jgi:transcriptional regulator with XRE-family HTH domain
MPSVSLPAAQQQPRTLIAKLATRIVRRPSTLSEVARRAGVSPSMVSLCASLKRTPSEDVKRAAEEVFGRPWAELFAPVAGDDL